MSSDDQRSHPGQHQFSPADFLSGPTLGEGRFGTVVYAEQIAPKFASGLKGQTTDRHDDVDADVPTKQQGHKGYAIKVISKSEILRHNQIQAVLTEKYILSEVLLTNLLSSEHTPACSKLFMKLFLCFHDTNCLYFMLELCAGGTLLDVIQSCNSTLRKDAASCDDCDSPTMDFSWVRYYSGQILRAIEYMHQHGVVHRDLSPKNIGISFPSGNIKLGDFGAAAVFVRTESQGKIGLQRWAPSVAPKTSSKKSTLLDDFVGTADYASPEMIRGEYTFDNESIFSTNQYMIFPSIDIWSYGCIIYHMIVGESPFHAASDFLAFQNVLNYASQDCELRFPSFVCDATREMILSLLSRSAASRLGVSDGVINSFVSNRRNDAINGIISTPSQKLYKSIRRHAFFDLVGVHSFWALLDDDALEPPYKPIKPEWMEQLQRGEIALQSLEVISYDL